MNIPYKLQTIGYIYEHKPKLYYRFYELTNGTKPVVKMEIYISVKKTPKGVVVIPYYTGDFYFLSNGKEYCYTETHKKFILDKSVKKYAHDNIEDAFVSYIKRKNRQKIILERQKESLDKILYLIDTQKEKIIMDALTQANGVYIK